MKRDALIRLRLTAPAKAKWTGMAGEAGVSLSEWIRTACRATARSGSRSAQEIVAEIVTLRREINRLGSNLNQLLHLAHTGRLDEAQIKATVEALDRAAVQITDALGQR